MKRKILFSSLLACAVASPSAVFAQEEVIEEIVVTGSLIPASTQEQRATPVIVTTDVDIAAGGSANIADVIRNQSFQFGVESVTNILAANGSAGTAALSNIRGLGPTSTLTLMNGKRSVTRNIRNLYPQILLQRLETVTDGASAIYGTDAVAGIVNFIPRTSFDGFEIETSYAEAGGDGDYNERDISFIGGSSTDDSNFVVAMSYRKRTRLAFGDRPYYSRGSFSSSGEANPGTYAVPTRYTTDLTDPIYDPLDPLFDAAAVPAMLTGATPNLADPGCGLNNQGSGSKDDVGAFSTGVLVFGTCRGEFGANFDYASPENVFNAAFIFNHDFSDSVNLETEFVYNRQESQSRGSPANPGGRTFLLPTIAGEHPGNPFRAMDSAGNLLFAADADGDGIPDRVGGVVTLAANPVVQGPTDLAFNEDVGIAAWRVNYYARQNGQPGPSNLNNDGTANGAGTFIVDGYRFSSDLNYEFGDSSWSGYTSYTYHRTNSETPVNTQSLSAITAGFTGNLATATGTTYFNPFSTQFTSCVDRVCGGVVQTDPAQLNSQAVFDQITSYERTTIENTLQVIDSIATGEVFEGWAGPIQAAIGAQWRFSEYAADTGPRHNSGDAFIQSFSPDFDTDREVYSVFFEAQVPLFDASFGVAELTLAGRSERTEDDSTADLDSDTYKIAARWEIADFVSTRASFGTTFISPSLTALFAPQTNGLSNVTDDLTGESGFKSRRLGGNPALQPEEADVTNIGLSLNFLDGDLTFDIDYKIFDFENRIVRPLPQDLLNDDFAAFGASGQTVAQWVAGANSDPRIVRNPAAPFSLIVVNADSVNATAQRWKGFDTRLSYGFDSAQIPFTDADFGRFNIVLAATYTDEYSFQGKPGDPTVNGAGRRNDETGFVPTAPRIRGNLRLGWSGDVHSVGMIGQYTHHYIQDDNLCNPALIAGSTFLTPIFLAQIGATNTCVLGDEIPSYTTWDFQYRADLEGLIGDTTTVVTLGAINMFDRNGVRDLSLGGTEVNIVNPVGRQIYMRFRQSF